MIIYCATNKVNNMKYVGQTIGSLETRWKTHCKAKSYLGSAIRKYGEENFSNGVIEECNSIDELNEREILWIKELNTLSPNGYNLQTGGLNYKVSNKTKEKMSLNHADVSGENHPLYNKKHSEETKEKISLNHADVSGESNSCFGRTGDKHPQWGIKGEDAPASVPIVCTTNGVIYPSLTEAAKQLGLYKANICSVLKGKYKQTGGYHFEYVKKEKRAA